MNIGGSEMKNWRTEKALYEVHEIGRKSNEVYHMLATGEEISAWCKMKNEAYGYAQGCGGDRTYNCWAVLMTY